MAEAPGERNAFGGAGVDGLAAPARAKVNLRLRVFGRDETGYHGLESLFLRLELADEVRLVPGGDGVRLCVECGEGVPPGTVPTGEENLCLRAARIALSELEAGGSDAPGGFEIRLVKRIPAGAGLGGGSADAAAVLRLVNRLAGDPLDLPDLVRLAGRLGSDVPFAVLPTAAALGWGRGDRLLPLEAPPSRPVLVAFGQTGVSTPEAFGWLDEDRRDEPAVNEPAAEDPAVGDPAVGDPAAEDLAAGEPGGPPGWRESGILPPADRLASWDALTELAVNDFEGPVFRRRPDLRSLRDALAGGALVARLAGSGQAVFAVFPDDASRDRAAEKAVEITGLTVRRTRTVGDSSSRNDDRWPLV